MKRTAVLFLHFIGDLIVWLVVILVHGKFYTNETNCCYVSEIKVTETIHYKITLHCWHIILIKATGFGPAIPKQCIIQVYIKEKGENVWINMPLVLIIRWKLMVFL